VPDQFKDLRPKERIELQSHPRSALDLTLLHQWSRTGRFHFASWQIGGRGKSYTQAPHGHPHSYISGLYPSGIQQYQATPEMNGDEVTALGRGMSETGFVQGADSARLPDESPNMPQPNACVRCHTSVLAVARMLQSNTSCGVSSSD
jgi:hypothetical protein